MAAKKSAGKARKTADNVAAPKAVPAKAKPKAAAKAAAKAKPAATPPAQPKLTALTPEQTAAMPLHAKAWIARALEVRPANREIAERGIRAHYRIANLSEPKVIVWTTSPLAAAIAGPVAAYKLDTPASQQSADGELAAVRANWHLWCGGAWWAGWPAAYGTFFRDVCGIDVAPEALQAAEDVTECGWWWPHKDFVIVSDRPTRLQRDDAGRLHSGDGPAVAWPDWSLYYWHGTRVPDAWIAEREKLTPTEVLHTVDMEVRRAGCEILGWNKILESMPHRVLDADPNPEIGTLVEIDLPDSPKERFVRAKCGTGRWVFYGASPDAKTAREACAESYSLRASEYRPELRT